MLLRPGFVSIVGGEETPVSDFTFIGTSTRDGTGFIPFPDGTAVNDVVIAASGLAFSLSGFNPAAPTGWTEIFGPPSSANSFVISYYKILNASDIVAGQVAASSNLGVAVVYRPNGTITSATQVQTDYQSAGGNPAAQTISGGSGLCILVAGACATNAGPVFSGTLDGTNDQQDSSNLKLRTEVQTSFTSRTVDINDAGQSNNLGSGYIQFT